MKRFIIVPLMLAFTISALGQSSKLTVGVESTTTITSMRGSDPNGIFTSQMGFGSGITASYSILPHLAISTGLGFERKGRKMKDISYMDDEGNKVATNDQRFNFDYLVLPIKASFQTGGKIKGYINGGLFVGYLLKYSEDWDGEDVQPLATNSDFKRIDGGLTVGVGALIPIYKRLILDVGGVENLGLCNIADNSLKTNSVGLLVGLKYSL
ncbi:porin family protein [uncultured Acetobacteroides sp.]|uniref:porin family protein n=1 Tax=uncultured Acetobacteroides sp. TaxID=1760811 RepID=UPI0029F4A542|nr:porin family protein [uncultured Acetobacteroides sp.]